jgi:hypothetical protein
LFNSKYDEKNLTNRVVSSSVYGFQKYLYNEKICFKKNITWEVLPKIIRNGKLTKINIAKEEFVLIPLDMNQLPNQYPKGLGMGPSSTNY